MHLTKWYKLKRLSRGFVGEIVSWFYFMFYFFTKYLIVFYFSLNKYWENKLPLMSSSALVSISVSSFIDRTANVLRVENWMFVLVLIVLNNGVCLFEFKHFFDLGETTLVQTLLKTSSILDPYTGKIPVAWKLNS